MTWDWRLEANCRSGVDPEVFFAEGPKREGRRAIAEAKGVCADCPVRTFCLQEALATNAQGVWGGMTEEERVALKRRQQRGRTNRDGGKPLHQRLSPDAHERRLANYKRGLTDPQMAGLEGVTSYEIASWRKANNFVDNYRSRMVALYQQFQALYDLGYDDGAIAAQTGEIRERVRKWRNRLGLPVIQTPERVRA